MADDAQDLECWVHSDPAMLMSLAAWMTDHHPWHFTAEIVACPVCGLEIDYIDVTPESAE